jgi:hypothetical protein
MKRKPPLSRIIVLSSILAVLFGLCHGVSAFPWFSLCAPRDNEGKLRHYNYEFDAEYAETAIIAIASADQPTTTQQSNQPVAAAESEIRIRKNFYVNREEIEVDDVHLSRLGLALYKDGACLLTGMLKFDGGTESSLLGANVDLKVRFYLGNPQHPGSLDNMPLLCESTGKIWVPSKQARAPSLLPFSENCGACGCEGRACEISFKEKIKLYFEEITHIEVILRHQQDR